MLDDLFLSITVVGEFWLPTLICAIVYWCIDMKSGVYMFSLSAFSTFFVHLFKMIACVYRPWILSNKVQPVGKALALAAGYSFPSGHSGQASALLGGLAFLLKRKTWIAISLILFVLVVGFSRMWLGVHTPQDVVVGLLIGFSLVFAMNSIINWAEKDKNRYLFLLIITNIAISAVLIYLCYFNRYPIDYINGKLLVDPRHSLQVSIFCYGFIAGILNGIFLCRRFFPFNPQSIDVKRKIIKGALGTLIILILLKLGMIYLFCNPCDFKIVFVLALSCGFFITALYPLICKILHM